MQKLLVALCMIGLSLPVVADFTIAGPLTLTTKEGQQQQTDFGFAYTGTDAGYVFQAGQQQLAVDEVPKRYTLSLVLYQDSQVWVTDFSKQPLAGFQWQLGRHQLKLYRQVQVPPQPGNMVLEIDGVRHFFIARRPAQVHFLFDDTGIRELRVEGTFKPKR